MPLRYAHTYYVGTYVYIILCASNIFPEIVKFEGERYVYILYTHMYIYIGTYIEQNRTW